MASMGDSFRRAQGYDRKETTMSSRTETAKQEMPRVTCPECHRIVALRSATMTTWLLAPHGFKKIGGFKSTHGCPVVAVAKNGGVK